MASAIPITIPRNSATASVSSGATTTPSLQSVLEQKRLSVSVSSQTLSNSATSSTTSTTSSTTSSSLPSLCSSNCDTSFLESCEDSHPLRPFQLNLLNEIDEDFFKDSRNIELVLPMNSNDVHFDLPSPTSQTQQLNPKSSFVSNLSQSLKFFTNSTAKQNEFHLFSNIQSIQAIQPRLTDDRFIHSIPKQFQETELKTFRVTNTHEISNSNSTSLVSTTHRNREARINPQFLRLYSHESSCRQKGILPEVTQQEEDEYALINNNGSTSIRNAKDARELALSIRQRLWQSVVLPPREDVIPTQPEYVFLESEDTDGTENTTNIKPENEIGADSSSTEHVSLIRKLGDFKPWVTLEDEISKKRQGVLRPRGILNKNVQFTVKGWCNSRFVSS